MNPSELAASTASLRLSTLSLPELSAASNEGGPSATGCGIAVLVAG
jgi:hypothetical protein